MADKPQLETVVPAKTTLGRVAAVVVTGLSTSPVATTTLVFSPGRSVTELGATAAGRPAETRSATLSPTFKLIFVTILGFILLAAISAAILVAIAEPTGARKELFDLCLKVIWSGFLAILGLVTGKAA